MAAIVYGSDLINADTGLSPTLRDKLDPEGFSVIYDTVPNGQEYGVYTWLKLLDKSEPVEAFIILTARDFGKIVRYINVNDEAAL